MGRLGEQEDIKERDLFAPAAERPLALSHVQIALRPTPEKPRRSLRGHLKLFAQAVQASLAMEWERGAFALLVPVALGIGALIYLVAETEPQWMHLLLGAAALTAITWAARSRPIVSGLLILALTILLGAVLAKFESWRADTRLLGSEISTHLTGRVVDIDHLANGRIRLLLDVLGTERPRLRYQPGRVRVSAAKIPAQVITGSILTGVVRLHPPPGPIRPDGYDFSFESYFDGIGANGFFLGTPKIAAEGSRAPALTAFMALADNARNAIASRVRDAIGGHEGEIAAALIVGVRAGIPEHVNEALRRTGLAHILSISGLHMALVAASVMISTRMLLAMFPGFVSTRPAKKYAAVLALLILCAYLFVSGVEVAAQRSFIMLGVMLLAILFDRQALTMRNLAIAATIVMVTSPHEIVGPSFQMSFAATAALIAAYGLWSQSRRISGVSATDPLWSRLAGLALQTLCGIAATAIIAGLATGIYGIWHFQRVSPFTLLANLAVTPIVSILVMPFGLLAVLAMPFGLEGPFLAVMGKGLSMMLAVANYLSAHSPIDAVGLVPLASLGCLTLALVIGALATTWLRLAAIPCIVAGLAVIPGRQIPDMFVAEDARLVALRTDDGEILTNRLRPNGFTIEGWQHAFGGGPIVKPNVERHQSNQAPAESTERNTSTPQPSTPEEIDQLVANAPTDEFKCAGSTCVVHDSRFGLVAVVADARTAYRLCSIAGLIVIQDATAQKRCPPGNAQTISARELARQGAAAVRFNMRRDPNDSVSEIEIRYAIDKPFRPWHRHRQYSRAARGLEPYKRQQGFASAKHKPERR